MKISVLLANYNHGEYLSKNIDAILGQTSDDWELVIVDDASTDSSQEIIRSYANREHRVRPYFLTQNGGAVGAYQLALRHADGDYVFGSAADDYVCDSGFFAAAFRLLREFPTSAGVFGRARVFDIRTGETLWTMGSAPNTGFVEPRDCVEAFFLGTLFVPGCAAIWKRELVQRIGGFSEALGPQTDYFVNHALPMLHGVVFHNEVVSATSLMPASYSQSASDEEFFRRHAEVERNMRDLQGIPEFPAERVREWRKNIISARLSLHRHLRLIRLFEETFGDIQGWERSGLLPEFVASEEFLRDRCLRIKLHLEREMAGAEETFNEVTGIPLKLAYTWTQDVPRSNGRICTFLRRVLQAARGK